MKITSIETIRVGEFSNLLWVLVHTDEGVTGLGETFMGAAAVEAYIHESAAPVLIGEDPSRINYLAKQMSEYVGFHGSGAEVRGASAVDIALWDLAGKALNRPLYDLIGGKTRDKVRTYNTCAGYKYIRSSSGQNTKNWGRGGAEGPYEDLDAFMTRADELAEDLLSQGITAMKIWPLDYYAEQNGKHYISGENLREGFKPFEKIRKAVGDKIDIMLECHALWDLPTAVQIAKRAEDYDVYWIEDPIRADNTAAWGEFKAQTRLRVTGSETIAGRRNLRQLIADGGVDVVMIDLGWCGGITEGLAGAAMADAHHLPVAPHDCTGPVVYAASTHMSLSASNGFIQESVRSFYTGWHREVAENGPVMADGYLTVPDSPGHGVALAPDLAKREDAVVRVSTAADL